MHYLPAGNRWGWSNPVLPHARLSIRLTSSTRLTGSNSNEELKQQGEKPLSYSFLWTSLHAITSALFRAGITLRAPSPLNLGQLSECKH